MLAANVAPANEEAPADEGHLEEPVDVLADELSMSLRYHAGLYGGKTIDRVILLGGEARQVWLCRQLVKKLRIPAQLGDPLMRLSTSGKPETPGLSLDTPQPGWAVACGLCTAIDQ